MMPAFVPTTAAAAAPPRFRFLAVPALAALLERPTFPPITNPSAMLGVPCWKARSVVYCTRDVDKAGIREFGHIESLAPDLEAASINGVKACELLKRSLKQSKSGIRISCGEPTLTMLPDSNVDTCECDGSFFFSLDGKTKRLL